MISYVGTNSGLIPEEFARANLMRDVWPCVTNITIHLPHDPNMLVAIQERVFLVAHAGPTAAMRGFVCF